MIRICVVWISEIVFRLLFVFVLNINIFCKLSGIEV